jgi:hypothetical protein
MTGHLLLLRLAAAALLFAAPSPLLAVPATSNSDAGVVLLRPLTLLKKDDLDFGGLIPSAAAGTATLDPFTGAVTTTGGVAAAPGVTSPALFVGAGSRRAPVIIRLPKNPFLVTRSGGTETMRVSNLTLDGNSTRQIGANEAFEFRVGGQLSVGANQAGGDYVGSFEVTVVYP